MPYHESSPLTPEYARKLLNVCHPLCLIDGIQTAPGYICCTEDRLKAIGLSAEYVSGLPEGIYDGTEVETQKQDDESYDGVDVFVFRRIELERIARRCRAWGIE